MSKFEIGDLVEITGKNFILGPHGFKVGQVVTLESREPKWDKHDSKAWMIDDWILLENEFKKVEVMQYEDKWHLNDGSVDIPDSAEKLMNPEGTSVVAFRYPVKEVVCTRWIVRSGTDFNSFLSQSKAAASARAGLSKKAVVEVKFTFHGDKLVKVHIVE
jgi:hypothetical protein